jgi:hypothetical protein
MTGKGVVSRVFWPPFFKQTTTVYLSPWSTELFQIWIRIHRDIRHSVFFVVSGVNDIAGLWWAVSLTQLTDGGRWQCYPWPEADDPGRFWMDPDPTSEKTFSRSDLYIYYYPAVAPLTNGGGVIDAADLWSANSNLYSKRLQPVEQKPWWRWLFIWGNSLRTHKVLFADILI